MRSLRRCWLALAPLASLVGSGALAVPTAVPRIVSNGGRHQLVVDDQPFLMLGAQVNNSSNYAQQRPEAIDEWRELQIRWFQFGAFSALFQSHGEAPRREIYETAPEGSPTYRAMEQADRLRYRLLPYIYTLAADTYFRDGTIMRGLVMDLQNDPRVLGIDDEYLFGPALLVAPVTEYKARSRSLYLPAGASWFDLSSGAVHPGGRTIVASAPYEQIPLFARAGAIIPTGPAIEWSGGQPQGPITLNVFTGADGRFSLYEDDGTSLGYSRSAYSRLPIRWDDKRGVLTLGKREGSRPGMAKERRIEIRWYGSGRRFGTDDRVNAMLTYSGAEMFVVRAH